MVTLVQLVAAVSGALIPHNDQARRAIELDGVHISELGDPTPFLDGGELLLTTGIPLTGAASDVGGYVERLHARGIGALAIGVGPYLAAIPDALRTGTVSA